MSSSKTELSTLSPGERFLVFKRSLLKGRYPRILEISSNGIVSLDPTKGLILTNEWKWEQIIDCEGDSGGITLTIRTNKGLFSTERVDSIFFECNTSEVLGSVLQQIEATNKKGQILYDVLKFSPSKNSSREVKLIIGARSILVSSPSPSACDSEYYYSSITNICQCADGLVVEILGERHHYFLAADPAALYNNVTQAMSALNIHVNSDKQTGQGMKDILTISQSNQKAKLSLDNPIWFSCECEKLNCRDVGQLKPCKLSIYARPGVIEETDQTSSSGIRILSRRSINTLSSILCPPDQPAIITLRFRDYTSRTYKTARRDELLCVVLDVAALNNCDIPLFISQSALQFQLSMSSLPSKESAFVALTCLLTSIRLQNSESSEPSKLVRTFIDFNANTTFHSFDDNSSAAERFELLTIAISFSTELLEKPKIPQRAVAEVVQSISRLARFMDISSKQKELARLGKLCLKKGDDFVVRSWLQSIFTLTSCQHQHPQIAFANRQILFVDIMEELKFLWEISSNCYSTAATSRGIAKGLVSLQCLVSNVLEPLVITERDNTPPEVYQNLLKILMESPRTIVKLLSYSSLLPNFSEQVALLFLRLVEFDSHILDESNVVRFVAIEKEVLKSGYFLHVFRQALFADSSIRRAACRQLLPMFCTSSVDILRRFVPPGLIHALDVPQLDQNALSAMVDDDRMDNPLFRKRVTLAQRVPLIGDNWNQKQQPQITRRNFPVFFHLIQKDHSLPDLIWNETTRNELKLGLDQELSILSISDQTAWNHVEFEIQYPSLSKEILLGDCYVRQLLNEDEDVATRLVKQIREPLRFFNSLFHHLLRSSQDEQRIECLRALRLVQRVHGQSFRDGFSDCNTIAEFMTSTDNRAVSDHAFMLLHALAEDPNNLRILARSELTTQAALFNINRIHSLAHQQPNSNDNQCKEWYFKFVGDDSSRHGPFSIDELKARFVTQADDPCSDLLSARFWAPGFHKEWYRARDIPQLRYELIMKGDSILLTEAIALASIDLLNKFVMANPPVDDDGRWIRPYPRAYRILTSKSNLHCLANALTAHSAPLIVDAAANLLALLGKVPDLVRKLYLTGAYYFALCYPGSNFKGISKFLFSTHLEQHFSEESLIATAPLSRRSILGSIIPEAMLHILSESSEKFTQVFVGGDIDNPEVIWTGEMRRELSEAILTHLQGFPQRLAHNYSVRFDFIPLPPVSYTRLQNETFSSRFFLKNLCNRDRFPDWPIADPVALMKSTMDAWRAEFQSDKASSMFLSKSDALKVLEIDEVEVVTVEEIKRAWRKLARQYHPDRNPAGREHFELIQAAFSQLMDPRAEYHFNKVMDPITLSCVLDCQILLMERFDSILKEFRYPGFDLLLDLLESYTSSGKVKHGEIDNEESRMLHIGCRLMYRACWVSHHNAQGLIKHIPRLANLSIELRGLDGCYVDLLRVIAGLAALSVEARTLLVKEDELMYSMCILPLQKEELCMRIPDAVKSVFQAGQTDLGAVWFEKFPSEYLRSVCLWMLKYDSTWSSIPSSEAPMYLESLLGSPPAIIRSCLAISAASVVLNHKKRFTDSIFPRSLLFEMNEHSEFDQFLTSFTQGRFAKLTLLWTSDCVAELNAFLSSPSAALPMRYSTLERELIVGNRFYVRVYVEIYGGGVSEPGFPSALVEYILANLPSESVANSRHIQLAYHALSLLFLSSEDSDQSELVSVLNTKALVELLVHRKESYVSEFITKHPKGVVALLAGLESLPLDRLLSLESKFFEALSATPQGALFLVLGDSFVFTLLKRVVLQNDPSALTALSNISWDKSIGERLIILLAKWIPRGLAEVVSNKEHFLHVLTLHSYQSPRLIWNAQAYRELTEFLSRMDDNHITGSLTYREFHGEKLIAGVYLRVFLTDPSAEFSHPEIFLDKALEAFVSECITRIHGGEGNSNSHTGEIAIASSEDDPTLSPLCNAVVALFSTRPNLIGHVSTWEKAPHLVRIISNGSILGHELANTLRIIKIMTTDANCLRAFAELVPQTKSNGEVNLAKALISVVQRSPESDVAAVSMETLRGALDYSDLQVARGIALLMLENDMAPALELLNLAVVGDNVKCKHRVHSLELLRLLERRFGGVKMSEAFDRAAPEWSNIRVQRHDLFLSDQQERTSQVFLLKGPAEAAKATEYPLSLTNIASSTHPGPHLQGNEANDLSDKVVDNADMAYQTIDDDNNDEPPL